MDFFEENQLEPKKIVLLDYVLNHYSEKNFWCFEISLPIEYKFLFEDAENNNVGGIFSRTRKIIIETLTSYFVLDGLNGDALEAFNNNTPFYFRLHNEKINLEDSDIVNVLSCNPM